VRLVSLALKGVMQNDGDFVDIILLYRRFGKKSEENTTLGRGDIAGTINIKGRGGVR
jgi:hypothetical protein